MDDLLSILQKTVFVWQQNGLQLKDVSVIACLNNETLKLIKQSAAADFCNNNASRKLCQTAAAQTNDFTAAMQLAPLVKICQDTIKKS